MPDPGLAHKLNKEKHHEEILDRTRRMIEPCADAGVPNMIAFTGYNWLGVDDPEGGEISKTEGPSTRPGLRELAKFASPGNVTLVLEQLNTRDDSHPMKGHPGYQGDDIDCCAEIVRRVDSPHVKLRFVCHAAIMNGDVSGNMPSEHIHVAGVPGRGEPDGSQRVH
jgi:hydroxypyruvate isomerase